MEHSLINLNLDFFFLISKFDSAVSQACITSLFPSVHDYYASNFMEIYLLSVLGRVKTLKGNIWL